MQTFGDAIDEDDRSAFVVFRTLSGTWTVTDLLDAQRITLLVQCAVKGPDGILVTGIP